MENHYATLGVARTATAAEIRNAYRRLAIKNHPDRNPDPKAADLFKKATSAYEVLGDAEKRRNYDIDLGLHLRRLQEKARKANPFPNTPPTSSPPPRGPSTGTQRVNLTGDLSRLSVLFSRGRYQEAESMAHSILNVDPRQPVPYALLADLARMDGRRKDAARLYALAIQMDPENAYYQRRYDEVLKEVPVEEVRPRYRAAEPARLKPAFWIGVGVCLLSAFYVCFSRDQADFQRLGLISTWSIELVALLFFSGIALGISFVSCRYVDRFGATAVTSNGTLSSGAVLSLVALLNFWLAAILFSVQGVVRGSFPYTLLRAFGAVASATLAFTIAASIGSPNPAQVFVWAGNVLYLGLIVGWAGTDVFR